MKKLYVAISFFSFFVLNNLSAQLNMAELYNYNANGHTYNDCWGYVDGNGNEYAIVGTKTKIYFYDITDPSNVVLVDDFSNNNPSGLSMTSTTWRDFKTYGTKAYAVADQSNNTEGLLVFDLSNLPTSVSFVEQNTTFFERAHNIFIDQSTGYLYTAGANTEWNGTIILDLNTDPISEIASPVLAGGYIHDLYVNNNKAYCNSGNDGLYVFDFTDHGNPETLGSLDGYVGDGYNHSCWPSESGDHLVFCDENYGRKVKICDVSDLNDIEITDQFYSNSTLSSTIAHNPFVKDDFVYVAYYHDGVYIFDISVPTNVTTHGYYDTDPNNLGGVWGVYPYFPSGNIIATDMHTGFFVLEVLNLPLPVELTDFSATAEKNKVIIEWTTASEENSKLFEVQKSTNGVTFETFTKVDAAGDASFKIDYLAYDERPVLGDNYYRLKQIDLDGKFELSEVEVVRFENSTIEIYPTLITGNEPLKILFAESSQDLKIQIYSIQGQLVQKTMLPSENLQLLELQLDELPNGIYTVQVAFGNEQVSKRIVIAR